MADSAAGREVLATIDEMTAALNTGDADRSDSSQLPRSPGTPRTRIGRHLRSPDPKGRRATSEPRATVIPVAPGTRELP